MKLAIKGGSSARRRQALLPPALQPGGSRWRRTASSSRGASGCVESSRSPSLFSLPFSASYADSLPLLLLRLLLPEPGDGDGGLILAPQPAVRGKKTTTRGGGCRSTWLRGVQHAWAFQAALLSILFPPLEALPSLNGISGDRSPLCKEQT